MSLAVTISAGNSITATTNDGKSVGFTSSSTLITYTSPVAPSPTINENAAETINVTVT